MIDEILDNHRVLFVIEILYVEGYVFLFVLGSWRFTIHAFSFSIEIPEDMN